MNSPTPNSPSWRSPTVEDLAGQPVEIDRADYTPRPRTRGNGAAKTDHPYPNHPNADDLAGVPVSVEGREDLTVRPARGRRSANP